MKKKVQDVYGEILRLRNEFYQKWQETSQYDDNRGAYKAKYEAFDKALELLTPSVVDPQPEEPIEYNPFDDFRHTDSEEPISEDLLDEIHNRWEDDPHTKWPKCPYKDFKNIAHHFADWQKQKMMKDAVDVWYDEETATFSYGKPFRNFKAKKAKLIIIKED